MYHWKIFWDQGFLLERGETLRKLYTARCLEPDMRACPVSYRNISPNFTHIPTMTFVLSEYRLNSTYLLHFFQKFKHIIYSILILNGKVLENCVIDILSLYISNVHNSEDFKVKNLNHLSLHQYGETLL